ncbi:MAG: Clp1/GlmU family protein [Nitrospirota bacterium]
MQIVPEPEWEELARELVKRKGTALLMGSTDSGKSTLARYLIEKLLSLNIVVSFVDSDIGQSSLSLPGTIGTKIFKRPSDIEEFNAEKIFFVGSLNPAKRISLMIEGTKRIVDSVRETSEIVLVDTTGLVSGEYGRTLKIGKIRAIGPEHIIAIQRCDEIEHILTLVEDSTVHRLRASRLAKERSREARIKYRKERFEKYFDKKKMTEFFLNDVALFYNGKPFKPKEGEFKEGTFISLNHNEDTRGMGILVELNGNSVTFKSPIKSLKGINRVILGDINLLK